MNTLVTYLETRFKNKKDYVLYHDRLISKTGVTMATLLGINAIQEIHFVTTLMNRETPHELIIYFKDENIQLCSTGDQGSP